MHLPRLIPNQVPHSATPESISSPPDRLAIELHHHPKAGAHLRCRQMPCTASRMSAREIRPSPSVSRNCSADLACCMGRNLRRSASVMKRLCAHCVRLCWSVP